MRYSFIGGTRRGYLLIKELLEKEHIPQFAVILEEDEHENEKFSTQIGSLLKKANIPFTVKKKLARSDYELIKNSNLDFVIVYGWRSLIETHINEYLKFGMIAVHHSLLPRYRGFAPVQWAIINGEKETGVSMFMIEGGKVDSGKIVFQEKVPISNDELGSCVEEKLRNIAVGLFLKLFEIQNINELKLNEQDDSLATYTCKRIPEDGKINWNDSSGKIHNLIRALSYPNTGAFCSFNNEIYEIFDAAPGENDCSSIVGRIPGRVFRISSDGIEVMCGEGTILLRSWKRNSDVEKSNPSTIVKSLSVTLK